MITAMTMIAPATTRTSRLISSYVQGSLPLPLLFNSHNFSPFSIRRQSPSRYVSHYQQRLVHDQVHGKQGRRRQVRPEEKRRSFSRPSKSAMSPSSFQFCPLRVVEPPIDSTVPERPCTVILMEDDMIFSSSASKLPSLSSHLIPSSTSWANTFRSQLPTQYGTSFASLEPAVQRPPSSDSDSTSSSSEMGVLVDDVFQELKNVMTTTSSSSSTSQHPLHDVVLVSRGPITSLCAQYYLESYPLLGLVMVDPICLPRNGPPSNLTSARSEVEETARIFWNDFWFKQQKQQRLETRLLLLEPNGAVPILVISTKVPSSGREHDASSGSSSKGWRFEASKQVAEWHSNVDLDVDVPFIDLSCEVREGSSQDIEAEAVLLILNEWIDAIL